MGIKTLKKQNPELIIDVVELLTKLDPTENNKMLPFLVKMYKKRFLNENNDVNRKSSLIGLTKKLHKNVMDERIKELIIGSFGYENMEKLLLFCDHLNNKRIVNTDVTSYSDWSDILNEVSKAELKLIDKELTKQIEVIYENDEWLVLKPLSFKASLTYGSNTKWCTAMKTEPDYFYRYSKNGILIYVINKNKGEKYGFHKSHDELSFWNQIDTRVDSMETNIPFDILLKIKEHSDLETNGVNYNKFSDEELEAEQSYYPKKMSMEEPMNWEVVVPSMQMQEWGDVDVGN
jgi:hypothetical protein